MRTVLVVLCVLLAVPLSVQGADDRFLEIGIRGGLDAAGTRENYVAREVYLSAEMPWQLPIEALSGLNIRLEAGAAQFKTAGDEGCWLAVGGTLVYRMYGDSLELEAGWRPTWLPDYQFGSDHFGGQAQFSTHVGMAFVWQRTRYSYRFQHTSNAGIYADNPGLDLHMFGVGFRF